MGGDWAARELSAGETVACSNAAFGCDPYIMQEKECWIITYLSETESSIIAESEPPLALKLSTEDLGIAVLAAMMVILMVICYFQYKVVVLKEEIFDKR